MCCKPAFPFTVIRNAQDVHVGLVLSSVVEEIKCMLTLSVAVFACGASGLSAHDYTGMVSSSSLQKEYLQPESRPLQSPTVSFFLSPVQQFTQHACLCLTWAPELLNQVHRPSLRYLVKADPWFFARQIKRIQYSQIQSRRDVSVQVFG
jgi:hypothetical protein